MKCPKKMDFFHCNACFAQPGSHTNKSFWLTNCGHSFCADCTDTGDAVCRLCNNACKYLALNNDMPDDVKSYFLDAIKELKKIIRIMLLQNKHSKIYMEEYVPKLEEKYVSAKLTIEKKCVEIETLKTTLKDKHTEVISLHKVIRTLESEIEDLKKQFSRVYQQPVNVLPAIPSTPKSFTSSLAPRESPLQNILRTPRTPRSNQTFSMTINTSPESSEDERWATPTPRRGLSLSRTSLHSPSPHFKAASVRGAPEEADFFEKSLSQTT